MAGYTMVENSGMINVRRSAIGAPSGKPGEQSERRYSCRNSRCLSPPDTIQNGRPSIKSNCVPAIQRELSTRVNWFLITGNARPNSFIESRIPLSVHGTATGFYAATGIQPSKLNTSNNGIVCSQRRLFVPIFRCSAVVSNDHALANEINSILS